MTTPGRSLGESAKLTVCYFGSYEPSYIRIRVMLKGLRKNHVDVVECNSRRPSRLLRFMELIYLFFRRARHADVILVSENGQLYVFLARLIALIWCVPVVFDVFLSHYHVMVFEAGAVKEGSLAAKVVHAIDTLSCRIADKVLLDTEDHIEYFCREFKVDRSKFESVPIGADDDWFLPSLALADEEATPGFSVVYVGTFYPLHGVEHIIAAAALLREKTDVCFEFYGDGPMRPHIEELASGLPNVVFHGYIEARTVPSVMAKADVCLGHFGTTVQATMVIPGKVYEALAMAKPIITADTPAIRRFLSHEENAYLCKAGNAEALANAILRLKEDGDLRRRIAAGGLKLYRGTATTERVGRQVKAILQRVREGENGERPEDVGRD